MPPLWDHPESCVLGTVAPAIHRPLRVLPLERACAETVYGGEELGVGVIPLEFQLKGKSYFNYPDEREISTKEFYRIVREGESATTSQVTVHRYTDYFEEVLKHGRDVLYIAFSSEIGRAHV